MTYRAKDLTLISLRLTEEQGEPLGRLLAELSSEWSEPIRMRAEQAGDIYTIEIKAADELD